MVRDARERSDRSTSPRASAEVRGRIAAAAATRRARPGAVTLVAATKTVAAERDRRRRSTPACTDLGENRAQELLAKAPALAAPSAARGTSSGSSSATRCDALAPWVACWQSVDRAELGAEIARRAPGARVLVEVNLAERAAEGRLRARRRSRALVDALRGAGPRRRGPDDRAAPRRRPPAAGSPRCATWPRASGWRELSMGMSDDFEVAVEEGATIVRVGRALFGPSAPDDAD